MIVFPNAKINIGLEVKSKRPDGYHNLSSIFYPVPICDALEMVRSNSPGIKLKIWNADIPGDHQNNLIVKAYNLLQSQFDLPGVEAHLVKNIPMGAGLGGGSSDGTFALCLINDLFKLDLDTATLEDLALKLGSDCPFFVRNQPALVTGRGENVNPIQPFLSDHFVVVVSPKLHISTAQAFSGIKPNESESNLHQLPNTPKSDWPLLCNNNFESTVFPAHSELQQIKELLYDSGAIYSSLTGTGSSIYGIFEHAPIVEKTHHLLAMHQIDIVQL